MEKQQIEKINNFILSDEHAKEMVDEAEYIAKKMINLVSSSQFRNIYGAIKKLEMSEYDEKVYRQLVLIKPKLAYMKGRALKKQVFQYENFETIISTAIDSVDKNKKETFKRFCQFIEAILAYHKVYGG